MYFVLKDKVLPRFKHHAMMYVGVRGKARCINCGTIWKLAVSFMLWVLCPWHTDPSTQWIGGWMGSTT